MPSKRIKKKRLQKKQQKQRQIELLQRQGYTEKEIKRIDPTTRKKEIKRLERNAQAVQRTQTNRQKLLKQDIPLSIITAERLDRKSYDNLTKKQLAKYRLKGKKLDALKARGIPYTQAKKDLSLSWDKLAEKYGFDNPNSFNSGKVYSGDTYLYVGFAQKMDTFKLENLNGWTNDELIGRIQERYKEAVTVPDDSGSFQGVFSVFVGNKDDTEAVALDYFERGYKFSPRRRVFKTDTDSYSKVTLRNDFSQRKFHELIYTCTSQMRNDQVPAFMDSMKNFCDENGYPFFKNLKL